MVEVTGNEILHVEISGTPKPQGSKRSFVVKRKGADPAVDGAKAFRGVVVDNDKAPLRDWRGDVTAGVQAALPAGWEPATGPLGVVLLFALPRPASAPKNRRTRPSGRVGDIDKLARSVLDSLEAAGVMKDDAQVVELHVLKDYPGPDIAMTVPGVRITVYHVTDPTGEQQP